MLCPASLVASLHEALARQMTSYPLHVLHSIRVVRVKCFFRSLKPQDHGLCHFLPFCKKAGFSDLKLRTLEGLRQKLVLDDNDIEWEPWGRRGGGRNGKRHDIRAAC